MLNSLVGSILTEFTLSALSFSHHDVAACIANLSIEQTSELERVVFHKMSHTPDYRICLVYLAGEGLTFLYSPLHSTFSAALANIEASKGEERKIAV